MLRQEDYTPWSRLEKNLAYRAMDYKLFYTLRAKKDLSTLDPKLANRILKKLDFYIDTGEPIKYAKKLSNRTDGTYRFRIGDYRIIFDVDKQGNIHILLILTIKHRREAYL